MDRPVQQLQPSLHETIDAIGDGYERDHEKQQQDQDGPSDIQILRTGPMCEAESTPGYQDHNRRCEQRDPAGGDLVHRHREKVRTLW